MANRLASHIGSLTPFLRRLSLPSEVRDCRSFLETRVDEPDTPFLQVPHGSDLLLQWVFIANYLGRLTKQPSDKSWPRVR